MPTETTREQVARLRVLLPRLAPRNREFAESLCRQYETRGTLSANQLFWVGRLITRAEQQDPGQSPAPVMQVGNLEGLRTLFDRAARHLRRPFIILSVPNRDAVRITPAMPTGTFAGSLMVASVNRRYGRRTTYGRVTDGVFHPFRTCTPDVAQTIGQRLAALSNNPAGVAAEYGHMHGHCCFCRHPLSDERSTSVGYGPICAGHYGLPWGDTVTPPTTPIPAAQPVDWGVVAHIADITAPPTEPVLHEGPHAYGEDL